MAFRLSEELYRAKPADMGVGAGIRHYNGVGSHTAEIERGAEGGGFIGISADTPVQPGEAIRFSTSGIHLTIVGSGSDVRFVVKDARGVVVYDQRTTRNLAGNAYVDTQAPMTEGRYRLEVTGNTRTFGPANPHVAATTFLVSAGAADAPSKIKGGGFLGGLTGEVKTIGLIGLAIVGALIIYNMTKKSGSQQHG